MSRISEILEKIESKTIMEAPRPTGVFITEQTTLIQSDTSQVYINSIVTFT